MCINILVSLYNNDMLEYFITNINNKFYNLHRDNYR